MKKAKKLISLLLALTMLLSMIPMAVAAETTVNLGRTKLDDAILEKGTPSSFSHLRDMKDGSAAKGVGETGFWQRLPRNTVVGYGTVTPVNYAGDSGVVRITRTATSWGRRSEPSTFRNP